MRLTCDGYAPCQRTRCGRTQKVQDWRAMGYVRQTLAEVLQRALP